MDKPEYIETFPQDRTAPTQKKAPAKKRTSVRQRITLNRSRLNHAVAIMLSVAIVFALLGNLVSRNRTFSENENRSLAQFPALSAEALTSGSWTAGINNWYNDQFFARDGWISLHLTTLKRLGLLATDGVYFGRNGYLLSDPSIPEPDTVAATVAAINGFAADHPELHITMLLAPDSSAILTDRLPKHAPVRDQQADIRDFTAQLSDQITCVDLCAALSQHTDEYIYYKTDHHWTSLGAYYAYQASLSALNIEATAPTFRSYTVTDSFEGTLSSRSGSHSAKDSIDIYLPDSDIRYYLSRGESPERNCSIFSSAALEEKDQYTVFFGGNYSKVDIQTTANVDRVLLVFKDSYANSFMQFLIPDYKRIIMVDPRYYYGSMEALLNTGVTDVLFLYSADILFPDTSLRDVLTAVMPSATESSAEEAPEQQADEAASVQESGNENQPADSTDE